MDLTIREMKYVYVTATCQSACIPSYPVYLPLQDMIPEVDPRSTHLDHLD